MGVHMEAAVFPGEEVGGCAVADEIGGLDGVKELVAVAAILRRGTEQFLTLGLCAPILEHFENRNRPGFEEPLHQPAGLDWSGRRNRDYAARESDCPADTRAGPVDSIC